MRRTVGVLVMEHIAVGLVEGHKVVGPLSIFPEKPQSLDPLQSMPAEGIVDCIRQHVDKVAGGEKIAAIGIGFPGIIRNGVGFGRYPSSEGIWEGGHSVVTLDTKENFCGCGGRGHLEGILGRRSMRLRFLDLEPEEVFENARAGDARCAEFVMLCHRALAAATATSIHMEGPGMFFVTGPDVRFIDIGLLDRLLHEMVKMSPLQGSRFEVVPTSDEMGIIGAAVNADRATQT